jgi:hypothetical protein
MSLLTESDLNEQLLIAMRLRICELEGDITQASESLHRALDTVRVVIAAPSVPLEDGLRCSRALGEVVAILRNSLARPVTGRYGPPEPRKVIPLRHPTFYEQSAGGGLRPKNPDDPEVA